LFSEAITIKLNATVCSYIPTSKFLKKTSRTSGAELPTHVAGCTLPTVSSASREQAAELLDTTKRLGSCLLLFLFSSGFSDYKAAVSDITGLDE